jgi:hypothetical protein
MNVSLSGCYPQLISMEGENNVLDVIRGLNLDATDRMILSKGYVTPSEELYLDAKHPNRPEMMGGFWGSLTKLAKKIPVVGTAISAGEGIADLVRGSKKSSGDSSADQQAALLQQQLLLQQDQAAKNKQMLMIAGGVGLLMMMMMMMQRK